MRSNALCAFVCARSGITWYTKQPNECVTIFLVNAVAWRCEDCDSHPHCCRLYLKPLHSKNNSNIARYLNASRFFDGALSEWVHCTMHIHSHNGLCDERRTCVSTKRKYQWSLEHKMQNNSCEEGMVRFLRNILLFFIFNCRKYDSIKWCMHRAGLKPKPDAVRCQKRIPKRRGKHISLWNRSRTTDGFNLMRLAISSLLSVFWISEIPFKPKHANIWY